MAQSYGDNTRNEVDDSVFFIMVRSPRWQYAEFRVDFVIVLQELLVEEV